MEARGCEGEKVARRYLESDGYRIVATNFHSRWGELDIVAVSPDGVLVFCEVKSYSPKAMVNPLEAVTPTKLRKIEKTIQYFLMRNPRYFESEMRIEVIATDGLRVTEHLKTLR